jgi:ubiquinone/menaquinone biosynthesis C-methylase UbiE
MLLKQKCIEFFDAASCTYDEVRFSTKSGICYDHLLKQKVYQFLKGESSILDAGAGTGRFSLYFASKGKKGNIIRFFK